VEKRFRKTTGGFSMVFRLRKSACCWRERRSLFLQRFAASRSGDEPRPSLYKYSQNFKLKTFSISNKSCASPFHETDVSGGFLM
jgi:hypothetical protein